MRASKRKRNRSLWLTAVLAVASVALLPAPAGAIVYGEPDGDAHPYVGALVAERVPGQKGLVCSGTLIEDDVFLTAAHCTEHLRSLGIGPDEVWVTFDPTFDAHSPLIGGTYVSHPDFNQARSDPKDIAVVLLDEPVAIQPAELPTAGLLDEMRAAHTIDDGFYTAVGYGRVRETRTGAFDNIFRNSERRAAVQSYTALTPTWLKFSMNQATGDAGTCYGDSGGPHFVGDTNLIVSISIMGDSVCKATDVTYRLDTAAARDFLDDFVALP